MGSLSVRSSDVLQRRVEIESIEHTGVALWSCLEGIMPNDVMPSGSQDHVEILAGRSCDDLVKWSCNMVEMSELDVRPRMQYLRVLYALLQLDESSLRPSKPFHYAMASRTVVSASIALIRAADEQGSELTGFWLDSSTTLDVGIVYIWDEVITHGNVLGIRGPAAQAVESKMILALERWSLTASLALLCMRLVTLSTPYVLTCYTFCSGDVQSTGSILQGAPASTRTLHRGCYASFTSAQSFRIICSRERVASSQEQVILS